MSKPRSLSLAFSLMVTAILEGPGEVSIAQIGGTGAKITICVRDYARVSPDLLTRAEKETTRIFRESGFNVEWQGLPLSSQDIKGDRDKVSRLGHAGFVLNIIAPSMVGRFRIRAEALGFASPCPQDETGCIANIFFDRVRELAGRGDASLAQVLGAAIAHEMGHLLLQSHAHSAEGIMRARWRDTDLQRASKGSLLFHPGQGDNLRKEVLKRLR